MTAKKPASKPRAKRIVRVNANLFSDDIERIRKAAQREGVSTSIQLRQVVHDSLNPLKAYKFFVRGDECVTVPLGEVNPDGSCPTGVHEISGVVAVCVARSQADALAFLSAYAAREGLDSRWLAKAPHAVEIPLNGPAFITWAAP